MAFNLKELQNIIDNLITEPWIKREDRNEIIDMAGNFAYLIIHENPMKYIEPEFHNNLYKEVLDICILQLQDVYNCNDPCIIDEICELIEEALRLCFTHIVPRRSYKTNIAGKPNIVIITKKIDYLKSVPQPDQRTNEWYEFRWKYLTASSIWKAFGTKGARNQLIYSKCKPLDISKYTGRVNLDSPLHWGQKYEDLSIQWYEREYKTKVDEFGCIPHKSLQFLAASPDGINTDPSSNRFGRMVEVKNIVNRDITGIPKLEYWIQMQIQMEVCELNRCDFLETRFIEYEGFDEFIADGSFSISNNLCHKGVMALFFDSNGNPYYEYAPWGLSNETYEKWNEDCMEKNNDKVWLKNIYWKLDEVSVVVVLRNKLWFDSARPILEDIWDTIEKERVSGYQHRAPNSNKRQKLTHVTAPNLSGCIINVTKKDTDNNDIVMDDIVMDDTSNIEENDKITNHIEPPKITGVNLSLLNTIIN